MVTLNPSSPEGNSRDRSEVNIELRYFAGFLAENFT
jgi:hypothetical protein